MATKEQEKNQEETEQKENEIVDKPIQEMEQQGELKELLEKKGVTEPVEIEVKEERKKEIAGWKPKTKLGNLVKEGKIKNIDEVFAYRLKILEPEIVDKLLNLKIDLIGIGQAKGKFGGGKRRAWRQTQKKTAEGNIPSFACMAVVGDSAGHVGIGYRKAKETLPAREKAIRQAKLNITKVKLGCGSFDCACGEEHSIPFKVKGKCGSAEIILMPAPKGTGLVVEEECKKILALAGIKDIYSKTFGQTKTKLNLAKACFEALKKTKTYNE
jgi:small subunit ribosomal protein S5